MGGDVGGHIILYMRGRGRIKSLHGSREYQGRGHANLGNLIKYSHADDADLRRAHTLRLCFPSGWRSPPVIGGERRPD